MAEAKVLVVDDDPYVVIFIVDQLEYMGYEVLVARNGKEGLEKAKLTNPDLLILDVMMPEMDGFEVCKRLKQDSDTWAIPVLMLTAKGQKEDVVKGFELGADDYLTKPYDRSEFEARVSALLRRFSVTSSISSTKHKQTKELQLDKLHQLLVDAFDEEELRTLSAFKLKDVAPDVDYDSLRGDGKVAKAREIIMFFRRRGLLQGFVEVVKEERPHLDWNSI